MGHPGVGRYAEEEIEGMCGVHFVAARLDDGDAFGAGCR